MSEEGERYKNSVGWTPAFDLVKFKKRRRKGGKFG